MANICDDVAQACGAVFILTDTENIAIEPTLGAGKVAFWDRFVMLPALVALVKRLGGEDHLALFFEIENDKIAVRAPLLIF